MKIGLGLPNADKSLTRGRLLVDIARRAEAFGFSSLATIGRVVYPNYDELDLFITAPAVEQAERLAEAVL